MLDTGVRQLFEGLRRAYNAPLPAAQQNGLARCRAKDAWNRYLPCYDTAVGLWSVAAFRSYLIECMGHEPTSHGIRPAAMEKLATGLDPANFNVGYDNFRLVSDDSQPPLLRAEFHTENRLTLQTILAGMSCRASEHVFPVATQTQFDERFSLQAPAVQKFFSEVSGGRMSLRADITRSFGKSVAMKSAPLAWLGSFFCICGFLKDRSLSESPDVTPGSTKCSCMTPEQSFSSYFYFFCASHTRKYWFICCL